MNKFIHQTTIVYLTLIVVLRMMSMPLALLDYSLNKSFITQNLCENRLNVTIHCVGKCYLTKQLARSSDTQDSRDQKSNVKILVVDFFEPLGGVCFYKPEIPAMHNCPFLIPGISSPYTFGIFHPPIV